MQTTFTSFSNDKNLTSHPSFSLLPSFPPSLLPLTYSGPSGEPRPSQHSDLFLRLLANLPWQLEAAINSRREGREEGRKTAPTHLSNPHPRQHCPSLPSIHMSPPSTPTHSNPLQLTPSLAPLPQQSSEQVNQPRRRKTCTNNELPHVKAISALRYNGNEKKKENKNEE
ncbi:hypothetical protein E2C01_070647 [Portunus trituberculatus]|uniref:Uncharacterized protein n=1 Tax=Portunus trituberculatus TaxID=210409 RepID=A0A5B7HUQ2_PORTR|nr:hypothetical protein [Portunus trituberculatus]